MKRAILFLVTFAVVSCPVWAARPLATDDAGTVAPGRFETELSFEYCRNRPDGACQTMDVQLKHGLTGRMDMGLAFGHGTDADAEGNTVGWGMSPLSISLKMALLKGHRFLPNLSLAAAFETGEREYLINGIASREIAGIGLHFNLGYESTGEKQVRGEYITGLAMEYTFLKKLRVCAELNGELLDDGKQVLGNSALIGGSIDLGFGCLDAGVRLFDKRGPKGLVTAGLTIGF